jgi:transcriptional regulator with XRE-family HTH domain
MKFADLLRKFREYSGMSPTELAQKMEVSPGYIFNLESGKQKPPTIERIEQISSILSLSKKDAMELLESAAEERIPKKDIRFFRKEPKTESHLSPDILAALQDPIAVKALLITYKNTQDIKNAIKVMLDCLPSLSPDKRQAILALCK